MLEAKRIQLRLKHLFGPLTVVGSVLAEHGLLIPTSSHVLTHVFLQWMELCRRVYGSHDPFSNSKPFHDWTSGYEGNVGRWTGSSLWLKTGLDGLFCMTSANAHIFLLLQKMQKVEGIVRMFPGGLTAMKCCEIDANSMVWSFPCAFRTVAISRPEWFREWCWGGSRRRAMLSWISVCLAAIK